MGKQNHFKESERDDITSAKWEYSNNYIDIVKPPIDANDPEVIQDTVHSLLPSGWREAVSLVEQYATLNTDNYMYFQVSHYQITFDGRWGVPFVGFKHPLVMDHNHPMYLDWERYAVEHCAHKKIGTATYDFVWSVINKYCNTPGQVVRIWPEFVDFLPPRSQQLLQGMVRAARPPKHPDISTLDFFNKRDEANIMIPKMMLAPKAQETTVKIFAEKAT